MLSPSLIDALEVIVGPDRVRRDEPSRLAYGTDGTQQGHPADVVVLPASTAEVSRVATLCHAERVPMVPRGGGTGYTGGAVPIHGGVVISLERLNRILAIDEESLLAVVQPNVVTGDLQTAVEARGLFYPPDPASLRECAIGGNVAECAGGPRAFKYGTTRRYILALEAVLPDGTVIRTGSKTVKNVVGYDLTQLLVGSEGTLAIVTEVTVRLIPKPPARATLRATFDRVEAAAASVTALVRARVVPSAIELIDWDSLQAIAAYRGDEALAPAGTGALLLIEVDGLAEAVAEEARRVEVACRESGAIEVLRAADEAERDRLWQVRRDLSPALKTLAGLKLNNDIVVPKGRIPELFDLVGRLRQTHGVLIACFGHAGDGNIHVNVMVDPEDTDAVERAHHAVRALFEGVIALEGSISGEHGIGTSKKPYLSIELSPQQIALMKRVKAAFDPDGVLNPGKMFPD